MAANSNSLISLAGQLAFICTLWRETSGPTDGVARRVASETKRSDGRSAMSSSYTHAFEFALKLSSPPALVQFRQLDCRPREGRMQFVTQPRGSTGECR